MKAISITLTETDCTTEYVFDLVAMRYTETVTVRDQAPSVTSGKITDTALVAQHIKLLVQTSLAAGSQK